MSSDECNEDSYAASCPDEATCDGDDDSARAQCPYDLCRRAAVTRFLGIVEPIGEYGIFVCIFETVCPRASYWDPSRFRFDPPPTTMLAAASTYTGADDPDLLPDLL